MNKVETLEINNFKLEELPEVIENQINELVLIEQEIKKAENLCVLAKNSGNNIKNRIDKKENVSKHNQEVIQQLSDAQMSLVEAQKLLFENQKKLSEGMKFLLLLGTSNIAMNKTVIQELESKLKGAAYQKLSVSSKNEIISIVKLLKEQESVFVVQEKINNKIKDINQIDKKQDQKDIEHDQLLKIGEDNDKKHSEEITKLKTRIIILGIIAIVSLILSIISVFK